MMACPIQAEEVAADLIICTHEHLDHMDVDALPYWPRTRELILPVPIECMKEFEKQEIAADRCHLLEEGKSVTRGRRSRSTLSMPIMENSRQTRLGVVLELDGVMVYHTGDTAYRPEQFQPAIEMKPDILLPCINGAFGNMDWREAAQLTQLVAPRVVIPTHFWMFVEQNGDPGKFLQLCAELAPAVQAILMKPGEEFLLRHNSMKRKLACTLARIDKHRDVDQSRCAAGADWSSVVTKFLRSILPETIVDVLSGPESPDQRAALRLRRAMLTAIWGSLL